MSLLLVVLAFLFSPLVFWTGGASEIDEAAAEPTAPFVLIAGDERQHAGADAAGYGEVTNVDAGQPVTIMRTDGRRARLALTLESYTCPASPVATATLAAGTSRWRVPRVPDDLYTLRVKGGGNSGSFGIAVGDGGDHDC